MNPWRSPGGILGYHTEDQFTQFLARWLPPGTISLPGDPFPVHAESDTVPTNNRFRLDDEKHPLPSRPESAQSDPEELVRHSRASSRLLPNHDRKLLSQRQVLKQKIAPRTEELSRKSDENPQNSKHWTQITLTPRRRLPPDFKADRSFCEGQVKDNQPKLAESLQDFWKSQAADQ